MPRRIPPKLGTPQGVSPLPEKPSLEYERKRAKRLLRDLRSGSPYALERARIQRVRIGRPAAEWKLADAQFILAREYGFSSWPRLVAYFSTWERHDRAGPMSGPLHRHACLPAVRRLLEAHREGRPVLEFATLAAFVPRFYGMTDEQILAAALTEEEARLAVARQYRFPSWAALVAYLDAREALDQEVDALDRADGAPGERGRWAPVVQVIAANRARDRAALDRVLHEHPELLAPDSPAPKMMSLLQSALLEEMRTKTLEAREKVDWLVSRGADLVGTLNRMLASGPTPGPNVRTEEVAYLLERGADPAWVAPNGLTVLEHALLRYWNPEAVDLIASRVTPRKAFWIAAGLGDVHTTLEFVDQNGAPTEAAHRDRPDFVAVGLPSVPCRPGADDAEVLWEAFLVAGMNQRFAALGALLDRGFPVDGAPWGMTLLEWAEGNQKTALVDFLKERGARGRGGSA